MGKNKRTKSEKKEAKSELKLIKKLIHTTRDNSNAVCISILDVTYWVGHNPLIVKVLKKERKEIKKFLKGKPNKWE